jgi:hypothetical protein
MEDCEKVGRRLQVLEKQLMPKQLGQPLPAAAAAAAAAASLSQQAEAAVTNRQLQSSHTAAQVLQAAGSSGQRDTSSPQLQLCEQCDAQQHNQQQQQQRWRQQQQLKFNPVPLLSRFGPPCEHVATLHDCWQAAVARFPTERALGWRTRDSSGRLLQQCSWMTYAQVRQDAEGRCLLFVRLAHCQCAKILLRYMQPSKLVLSVTEVVGTVSGAVAQGAMLLQQSSAFSSAAACSHSQTMPRPCCCLGGASLAGSVCLP